MATTGATRALAAPLRTLWGVGVAAGLSDGQLIDGIVTADVQALEPSFQLLLERHGPMVLRVCQRMLNDPDDADDAFQATFLVLLRHADRIRDRSSVASWLHGVAARIAARARVEAARRRRIERRGVQPAAFRDAGAERRDLESLIEDELARLPAKYRAPIVLCYLEGRTHEVAAEQLGWPVGTVRGRLARARDLLRARLIRRGVTATAAFALAHSVSENALSASVPVALCDATVRNAVQVASGRAINTVASVQVAAWVAAASSFVTLNRSNVLARMLILSATLASGIGLAMATASRLSPQTSDSARIPPAPSQDDRAPDRREMLKLKGTWTSPQTTTLTLGGVPQSPKTYKLIWSIDRDTITESDENGFASRTYRFTLDRDRTPKTIDLTLLNSPLELHGIYKLEGDTLTICEGLERPGDFGEGIQIVFHRENRTPARLLPEYPNAPGCFWAVEVTTDLPRSMASGGVNLIIDHDPDGALVVTIASIARLEAGEPDREYRPVAFDEKKNRHLLDLANGGASSSGGFPEIMLSQRAYRLDPMRLKSDDMKALGVEVIPAEVRRAEEEARSARAFQEAKALGIEILPSPEVGKPFVFTLTPSDGQAFHTAALKGKVVLIDFWASWRSPCMGQLDEIKAIYDRRRQEGFEVIGVSLNRDRGKAEQLVKMLAIPWPQVYLAGDDRARRLWADGPGIAHPHLLLIDRDGILRWYGGPEEVKERITKLLDAPQSGK